jgi:hypothetical protein
MKYKIGERILIETIVLMPYAAAPYNKLIRYANRWWIRYCYPYMTQYKPKSNTCTISPKRDDLIAVFKKDLIKYDHQYIKDEFEINVSTNEIPKL